MLRVLLTLVTCLVPLSAAAGGPAVLIEPGTVESAAALAAVIDGRVGKQPPAGVKWFEELRGSAAVIVTAPHANRTFREGEFRFADGGGTAGIAKAAHEICGATALYTSYEGPAGQNSDPNYYDNNEFKQRLGQLIGAVKPRLVLDIHASNGLRPYDVDIGDMNGASHPGDTGLVEMAAAKFRAAGFPIVSYNRFPAADNATITKFAAARGVDGLQLEISRIRLDPAAGATSAHLYAQTMAAVVSVLQQRGLCSPQP